MVFVRAPFINPQTNSKLFNIQKDSLKQIHDEILLQTGLNVNEFTLYKNGREFNDENESLDVNSFLDLCLKLPGGKGGFGSMLRALGAQINKNTNKDACRDLSGRRLRDIKDQEALKKFVDGKAEREREKQEKKEAKLNKLRRLANDESKHEFKDTEYMKKREEAIERVHDGMEQAFKNAKEKEKTNGKQKEESKSPVASTSGVKRKVETTTSNKKQPPNKKGLWLGVDLNDSDLDTDDSDEEEETSKAKIASK